MTNFTLDLDVGNTRTKWRVSGGASLAQGVCENGMLGTLAEAVIQPVGRVRLACVAADTTRQLLRAMVHANWGCDVEEAVPLLSLCGLQNAYQHPERLGVDRWLAALAVWHAANGTACLVVDAGSALTIDMVNDQGVFQGGYIIPGLQLMQRSLISDTGQIRCETATGVHDLLREVPSNTALAVQGGAAFAVCAITEKAVANFLRCWPHGTVRITGGDGKSIALALDVPDLYAPDLVLDGLALALP